MDTETHRHHVDFHHLPHPHIAQRQQTGPPRVRNQVGAGLNSRIGLRITLLVGTMVCAYLFAILALVSLPSVIRSGDPIVIVAWISQSLLQLVLLPVIIVGQNLQAAAADERASATFRDAEAVLHEAQEIQRHLHAQDDVLTHVVDKLGNPHA